jgi:hypothetical protein
LHSRERPKSFTSQSPANEKTFEIINVDWNFPKKYRKIRFENSPSVQVKRQKEKAFSRGKEKEKRK